MKQRGDKFAPVREVPRATSDFTTSGFSQTPD